MAKIPDTILRKIQNSTPDIRYSVDVPVGGLERNLEQFKVNIDPEYQRGHVWTEEQQSLFVGAFLENSRACPPFIMNFVDGTTYGPSEVVDGKQRLTALRQWLNGEIIAHAPCGISVWHKDLEKTDLSALAMMVTMQWKFVGLSKIEVMKYYLRLNSGGTVHSKKELDRVRKLIEETKP
jgi:hypothetical protein